MKPTRFLTVALVLMGLVATASAITEQGTIIQNQAIGNYQDANGNDMTQVTSLVVSTTVSQVAGVSLGADKTANVSAMDSTLYAVTLSNTGNGSDTYTIGATGAANDGGTYDFYVYHDGGTLGVLDGTDEAAEITSSGVIVFTGDYNLLIKVVDRTSGGGNPGEQHVVTLTATSGFATAVKDTITLTSTITAATVGGTTEIVGDNTPAPGEPIVYQSCFTNSGSETAYNPVFVTQMPSNTTLDVTSVKINGGSAVTIVSTALDPVPADLPYHYNTATRTLTLELSDLGTNTGVDDAVCVQFAAIVDDPLAAGSPIDFPANNPEFTYENGGGDEYPGVTPIEDPSIPETGVPVAQTYAVTLALVGTEGVDDTFVGDPGDVFEYPFTVTNGSNGTDNFDLDWSSTYIEWVFYVDTDGDGVLEPGGDDADTTGAGITNTGNLLAGIVGKYVAVGTIPAGTGDTETDATTFTATSMVGAGLAPPVVATGTDTASATCTAPALFLLKSVTIDGVEYFSGAANFASPGDVLTYTIVVTNTGSGVASNVVVSDTWNTTPGELNLNDVTYVAGSMLVDGNAEDDDALTGQVGAGNESLPDYGEKTGSSVIFDFDTMDAAGGASDEHIVSFQVTIN